MKYILETTKHVDPQFIPCVPKGAKQEFCSTNWRKEKQKKWVIELNTIEDVERLQQWAQENYEDYTGLIFLPKKKYNDYPVIEIYNDWRE